MFLFRWISCLVFLILSSGFCYGYAKLPEKVVICGVCKDVEERLPLSMKIMERIGTLFKDYRIIIYENNSRDRSADLLKRWSKKNPKVYVQCEWCEDSFFSSIIVNRECSRQLVKHYGSPFARIERIARARNIVQDLAMSSEYEEFPYIIWMDMDFRILPALEGIVEVFTADREWDAVFAYGLNKYKIYYDWYAFRDANFPLGSELLGETWWRMKKKCVLSNTDDWYPVYSAFGGCGIYKKSSVVDCHYSAVVTSDMERVVREILDQGKASNHPQVWNYFTQINALKEVITLPQAVPHLEKYEDPNIGFIINPDFPNPVTWTMSTYMYQYPSICEHVPFHASMIVRGHNKLFINPRLIFNYED